MRIVAFLVVTIGAACDLPADIGYGKACVDDTACDPGYACNGSICVRPNQIDSEPDAGVQGCIENADCDDGEFCNGLERCNDAGACEAGFEPCGGGLFCVELEQRCVACVLDVDCDDGFF